jgi:uncharacterized protein (TIGR02611 family)
MALQGIRQVKRVIVAVVGFTVLAVGIVMIVLPGPAFIVIPLGLAILATEFVWARKLLRKVKTKIKARTDRSGNNDRET